MENVKRVVKIIISLSSIMVVVGGSMLTLNLSGIIDRKHLTLLFSIMLGMGVYQLCLAMIILIKINMIVKSGQVTKQNLRTLKILSWLTLYRYLISQINKLQHNTNKKNNLYGQ